LLFKQNTLSIKALEVNPDDINVLSSFHTAYLQTGQRNEAISVVRKALAVATSTGQESLVGAIEKDLEKLCQADSSSIKKTTEQRQQ
jgi:Flp pilus assembly protein TadD